MLGNLPPDVLEELTNPDFLKYTHHRMRTYNMGCRGPLCRKARRDKARSEDNPQRPYFNKEKDAELQRIAEILEGLKRSA